MAGTSTPSIAGIGMTSNGSVAKKYKSPSFKRPPSKLSLTAQDKWAKRVIAPYVTLMRKGKQATLRRDANYYNFFLTKKSSLLMKSLKNYISNKNDLPALLHETADILKVLTDSLGVRLYFVDREKDQLYQYQKNVTYPRCRVNYDLNCCKSVACYVARTKEFVMVDDVYKDGRFPDGVNYKENIKPVLCVPIVTHLSTYAVIELYREMSKPTYKKNDLKLAVVLCGWMGLTIQENQEGYLLHMKQTVNQNLLQMVLTYYSNPATFESLISEMLNYAKKELYAEKGTFYVITNTQDLIADVYEEGLSDYNKSLVKKKQAVHFGRENTVACLVAREMRLLNVKDLYNDPRFKSQVNIDEELMIIERTELCVPIINNEVLLGIISLMNKGDNAYFTIEDEHILDIIATYAGMALFYAQGQRQIEWTRLKYESTLELLQYHLKPCQMELDRMHDENDFAMPKNIDDFSYYIMPDEVQLMPQLYVKMLRDIIPDDEINFPDLYSFVLTAQRSYRNNPYHNFEHAFTVSHCMYAILIRNIEKFTLVEKEALLIAALTHDIDHSGVTNNFLYITNNYLSKLYNGSLWENHHCFVTEQLLKKYNVFRNVTDEMQELFLREVHENIMCTDLAYYFKNRNRLVPIVNSGDYNINNHFHKYLTRSVCMTMSDLSGQSKPFSVTKRLTDSLYREFYTQGDMEKEMGFTPLPTMDREYESQIPDDQSQFLSIVVMSAADLIRSILPNTEEIFLNAEMLRDTWRNILESRGEKLWRQCDSLVS